MFFNCEGDKALVQVAQACCGVTIFGDTKKMSGHGPRQLILGGPA